MLKLPNKIGNILVFWVLLAVWESICF